jgi:hypothetical protein
MALPVVPATNIGMSDLAQACGVSNTVPGGAVSTETFVNLSLNGLRSGTGGNLLATKTDSTANLAEGVDTSETAIDVTDGSQFTAQQYIQVNNEIMRVTGVSSNTLTVLREESSLDDIPEDAVGDSHTNGTDVYHANPFVPYAFPDDLGLGGGPVIVQGYLTSWLDAVDGGSGYGGNTTNIGMKLTFYTNAGSGRAADVDGYVGR